MRGMRKKLALVLAVLLVLLALAGCQKPDETAAGVAYLEELERKDPVAVEQVRQQLYQAKIQAKRDEMIRQLSDGTIDPFSLFQNYVLMGDSRAVGFWYRDFLEKDQVIADGGHTIRNLKENIDKLVQMNPQMVFLCYGLNDSSIGYWDTAEEYVAEYMDTVSQIRQQLPDTTIVVSSILPARDPAFQLSSKWYNSPQWSAALETACKENGIAFANCDQLALDYPELWDPDGIHFREAFYPHWASYLVTALLMEDVA